MFKVCIIVCVSDLSHQVSGLLHFVAISNVRDKGRRIMDNYTCHLHRLEQTLRLGVPFTFHFKKQLKH